MISFKQKGDFKNLNIFFQKSNSVYDHINFKRYGELGVIALKNATPKESGETADSWSYEVEKTKNRTYLRFYNSNINDGCNVAVVLQYGHVSRNGTWVEGIDYINPALQPIFNDISEKIWKEVKSL